MIVAGFIGVVFLLALFFVWIDLGELIAAELAAEVDAGRTAPSFEGALTGCPAGVDTFGDAA